MKINWVKIIWGLFAIFWFSFAGILICAYKGWLFFDPLPDLEELENPVTNLASEIISSDNKVLGHYFRENRVNVNFHQISPYVVNALVATEDERFYQHPGIDVRSLARAIAKLGKAGGASTITQQLAKMMFTDPARNTFKRILQKIQEWIIAYRLEKMYTKEEILTMYLNRLDFVNHAVGIKSAAEIYFSKDPSELQLHEAAMLVGMAKNPSLFNPLRRPDTTLYRRNVVFAQMLRNKMITKEEFDSLKTLPLGLNFKSVDHKEGLAPYFREVLRLKLQEILQEKDPETGEFIIKKPNGKPYDIYKDGLRIYVTIDTRMQALAEKAVKEHLSKELQPALFKELKRRKNPPFDNRLSKKEIESILWTAIKRSELYRIYRGKECPNCHRRGGVLRIYKENGMQWAECTAEDCGNISRVVPEDSIWYYFEQPKQMRVFTWQGEIDTLMSPLDSIKYYKSFLQAGLMSMDPTTGYIYAWVGGIDYKHFAYDHVYQAKRQVGSTFKPIVYTVAIREGLSPCTEIPNIPYTFYKGEFGLLQDWTPKNSENDYGYNVTLKYGLANSLNTVTSWIMKKFGPQPVVELARNMGIESHLEPVPSLCLGVADISVFEMTGAFATFANKGIWIEPAYLLRIEDKHGNVIKEFKPRSKEAMDEKTAYIMLQMLKAVVDGAYNETKGKSTGTAMRLRGTPTESRPYVGFRNPIAGKTGTTQNNSDAWFIGLTPDLVTGVWVGAEDRSVRFSSTYYGQGANMALPIWGYYMKYVYAHPQLKISQGDFEKPDIPIDVPINCKEKTQMQNGYDIEF